MNKKTIHKKKISKECWALEYAFVKWLNEHLKVYLHDASKYIDLDFHQYIYNGEKIYTQKQMIEKMIALSDKILNTYDQDDYKPRDVAILCNMWSLVINDMWW